MQSLSVRQPWASLIANGSKTIEVRSWRTAYRGPLLICASARQCDGLPTGVAVAIVDVVDCCPSKFIDSLASCCPATPAHFSWVFSAVHRLAVPFPVKGRLHLYDVADSLIAETDLNSFLAKVASING